MSNRFRVSVLAFEVLQELEGVRGDGDYVGLLDRMEFGDTAGMSASELREMCLMSLQDLEPAAAAAIVLEHDLGDSLRKGQIVQMGHSMIDEKLWEQYPDMALHERLFHVASLAYAAFPRDFPEPDAVRATLEVRAENPSAEVLLAAALPESLVVRLIADGLPQSAVLHRLFGDQIAGDAFPEASAIMWIVESEALPDGGVELEVISSGYWLDALRETRGYTSTAYPDEVAEERATDG